MTYISIFPFDKLERTELEKADHMQAARADIFPCTEDILFRKSCDFGAHGKRIATALNILLRNIN